MGLMLEFIKLELNNIGKNVSQKEIKNVILSNKTNAIDRCLCPDAGSHYRTALARI